MLHQATVQKHFKINLCMLCAACFLMFEHWFCWVPIQ